MVLTKEDLEGIAKIVKGSEDSLKKEFSKAIKGINDRIGSLEQNQSKHITRIIQLQNDVTFLQNDFRNKNVCFKGLQVNGFTTEPIVDGLVKDLLVATFKIQGLIPIHNKIIKNQDNSYYVKSTFNNKWEA